MRTVFLALCLCFLAPALMATNVIPFQEQDFHTIQAEAQRQDKPFFIFYYGRGCAPCQMMKKNTFTHPTIVQLVNDNFIAASADLNSDLGRQWRADSDVMAIFLPTIIFFSPQGKYINKYEKGLTVSKFEALLQKNLELGRIMSREAQPLVQAIPEHPVPASAYTPQAKPQNLPEETLTASLDPSIVLATTTQTTDNPLTQKKARLEAAKTDQPLAEKRKPAKVKRPSQTTYIVQLGFFKNVDNLDKYIENLKQKTNREDINYIKDIKGDRIMYRVIVGENHSVSQARRLVKNLENDGIDAFMKKL